MKNIKMVCLPVRADHRSCKRCSLQPGQSLRWESLSNTRTKRVPQWRLICQVVDPSRFEGRLGSSDRPLDHHPVCRGCQVPRWSESRPSANFCPTHRRIFPIEVNAIELIVGDKAGDIPGHGRLVGSSGDARAEDIVGARVSRERPPSE
jgi:hypothetical protein